jgi:hypothetical protein
MKILFRTRKSEVEKKQENDAISLKPKQCQ